MSLTARDRKILAVLVVVALVAAYWLLILGPTREEAAEAAQYLAEQEERLDTAEATLAELEGARDAFENDYATVVRLGKALPADVDVPSLMVQLEDAAERAGIEFDSITVGDRAAVEASAAPAPGGTEPAPAASPETAPAGDTIPAPASSTSTDTSTTGTDPATASSAATPSLEGVTVDFGFRGDFFDLADLLHELKRFVSVRGDRIDVDGRLTTIDSVSLTPSSVGRELTAEISATAYLAPAAQGPTAGATPAGPAAPASPATQPAGQSADSSAPPSATSTAPSRVAP